jgi:hypothetical protein
MKTHTLPIAQPAHEATSPCKESSKAPHAAYRESNKLSIAIDGPIEMIPKYVEDRIKQTRPTDVRLVAISTPVVSFGDVRTARVATLGLNPSNREFADIAKDDTELPVRPQRLETLTSLGITEWSSGQVSPDVVRRVFDACNGYFQPKPFGNPLREWFDDLDAVSKATLNVSYFQGTACHLDLVQWATHKKWRYLDSNQKASLIRTDINFLKLQLSQEHIKHLFLNGTGVVNACRKYLGWRLAKKSIDGISNLRLSLGRTPHGAQVIGWNENLQSSWWQSQSKEEYTKALVDAIRKQLS